MNELWEYGISIFNSDFDRAKKVKLLDEGVQKLTKEKCITKEN